MEFTSFRCASALKASNTKIHIYGGQLLLLLLLCNIYAMGFRVSPVALPRWCLWLCIFYRPRARKTPRDDASCPMNKAQRVFGEHPIPQLKWSSRISLVHYISACRYKRSDIWTIEGGHTQTFARRFSLSYALVAVYTRVCCGRTIWRWRLVAWLVNAGTNKHEKNSALCFDAVIVEMRSTGYRDNAHSLSTHMFRHTWTEFVKQISSIL